MQPPYARQHTLPIWGHFAAFQKKPLALYRDTAQEGDVVRLWMGVTEVYHIVHPTGVQHVLQDNQRNYGRHPFGKRLFQLLTGDGILTLDGEPWLRQRRLAQPAFHRQRLAAFGDTMVQSAQDMVARWESRPTNDTPLLLTRELSRLTLHIAGKTLLNTDISDPTNHIGQTAMYGVEYARERLATIFPAFLAVPTSLNRRYRPARQAADKFIYDLIHQRRQQAEAGNDLLGLLLDSRDEETNEGLTDREIHDQLMTMLFAGQETTANALAWSFYLLARHPQIAAQVRAEVGSVLGNRVPTAEDLPHLTFTRMVVEEAMRLYPPIWLLGRRAIGEDEILGYRIPKGALIAISPYALHHHPAYWEQPAQFDPARFEPSRAASRPRFAYLPFGAGARQCIGSRFAMMEAQLVLATLLPRFDFALPDTHDVEPEPLLNLRPKGGLPMLIHIRVTSSQLTQ